MIRITTLTICSVLIVGCATPFSQFYFDQTGGADITTITTVIVSQDEPEVFRGNKEDEDSLHMLENGYVLLGYSSFNAENANVNEAIAQAKEVHASVSILYSKHTGAASGPLLLTLPDTHTSTTSLHGGAYGSGGHAADAGSAHTPTYSTKTTDIPYSAHRTDYLATYWIKVKPPIFGTHIRELTPVIRKEIKSNKGVLVNAVIKGSPAFHADILRGDVLREIGNIEIYDAESFQKALAEYAGRKVRVVIARQGREIEKEVQLNENS